MTNKFIVFILLLSALLFGAVEIWSSSLIILMVYTLGLVWVMRAEYSQNIPDRTDKLILATGSVMILYIILQAVPLPSFLLKIISPVSYQMQTYYALDQKTFHISLYPYKTGIEILYVFALFIIFCIAMLKFRDRENFSETAKVLVIFGFTISVFAIVQMATWNGHIYWFRELTHGGSPFGPFVNRNHFAGYVGMLIPIGLALAFTRREREKKILYGFITVIMAVAVFLSLSRGGIISFFAGVAMFSLLIFQDRLKNRKFLAVGLFLIAVASYLVYLGIDPIIDRFYKTDISKEQRLIVWSDTFNAFRDFWLTGSGTGTFINIYPLYSKLDLQSIYIHAHNDYLEFMLETGMIGVILLLVFAVLLVHSAVKNGISGRAGILKAGTISSVFTMTVHSIFDFNLHILSNALLFATVLGMMTGLSSLKEQKIEKPSDAPE
ncbi:MAG: hypothetical protein A2X59_11560, partial [Nitrospirae bacterium GWC2_42_7]